jgi:mycothiol system anti-sigma-R factor
MSCGDHHDTPCAEVLNSVVLLIDGEIEETSVVHNIETHLDECPPCKSELEHERKMHDILHEMLTRSCCEKAPQELHEMLAMQLQALHNASQEIVTEYRMTEISIHIEDFGQIEHHEITIESTQEYRYSTEGFTIPDSSAFTDGDDKK